MNIVTDCRKGNAILKKMAIENNKQIDAHMHPKFKYVIECDSINDLSFYTTEYHNKKYKVQYISGCFYPFLTELVTT